VTHSYPLYVPVLAQCFCCRSLQPFTFGSASDQVVCALCLHHLGAEKAERRDAEHVELWLGQFAEQQDKHRRFADKAQASDTEKDAAIARLTGQVDDLRRIAARDFEHAPGTELRGILETDLVKRAERRAELAQHQIDWAMAVLWRLGTLHHADVATPRLCSCGRQVTACAELRALEPQYQAVHDWQTKNLRMLHAGKRHGLPADHPGVVHSS